MLTMSAAHDFTDGEILSFRVSAPFGTVELNNKQARVLSHTSTDVTVDLNSQDYTAFVDAGVSEQFPAVALPSSSGIVPDSNPVRTSLDDAFDVRRS